MPPKKILKTNIQYDPAISLLVICSKDLTFYSTNTCSTTVISVLFTIARKWKEVKCLSTNEWIMNM